MAPRSMPPCCQVVQLFSSAGVSGTHTQIQALPRAHTCVWSRTHTYTHAPRLTDAKTLAHMNTLGPLLPTPALPQSESPSSLAWVTALPYPTLTWARPKVWSGGPSHRGDVGWAGSPRPRCTLTWISSQAPARRSNGWAGKGCSSPSSGQVPQPQLTLRLEASGYPKWGAHDVRSWGRPGQSGPLCASPTAGRRARP